MDEQFAFIEKYVRNVFFVTDCGPDVGQVPSISGTCVLLKYEDMYYVVTAKHVLHDHKIQDLKVLLDPYSEDAKKRHRSIAFENAFTFNSDDGTDDYDSDCNDICILKVHPQEPKDLLDPFFFPYSSPSCRDFNKDAQLIVAGFPTSEQDIRYEFDSGSFQAIYLPCQFYERILHSDFQFKITVTSNKFPKDFDGFSGAPIFCIRSDRTKIVSGIVIRGSACSRSFFCLDIRLFEAGLISKKIIDKENIKPDMQSN